MVLSSFTINGEIVLFSFYNFLYKVTIAGIVVFYSIDLNDR